mgnify:CR=1 FL=1
MNCASKRTDPLDPDDEPVEIDPDDMLLNSEEPDPMDAADPEPGMDSEPDDDPLEVMGGTTMELLPDITLPSDEDPDPDPEMGTTIEELAGASDP